MAKTTAKPFRVTRAIALKVLRTVSKGLSEGLDDAMHDNGGWDERLNRPKPGFMCVEAAVCYALGQRHGDNPSCVAPSVRAHKIHINDSFAWRSKAERARGMRRLAIAQLGSKGVVDARQFSAMVRAAELARKIATGSAYWDGAPSARFGFCEDVVQILKQLGSPGARFLSLAPVPREAK